MLAFTHPNYTIEVKKDDVVKVEIYNQKNLGKFGSYNYVVIYTIDQKKLLITRFTVPLLLSDRILESFLSKKPRIYFKKQFNYINEEKFKP
ncbi:MAG: hypothetical protein JWR09_5193 [Mucilaginibacter sp.]|nr:hypothetical protein [Mucilaginibacter sp.]